MTHAASTHAASTHAASLATPEDEIRMACRGVNVDYWGDLAIKNVTMDILSKKVTAFIGPSGCGKSTFLRALNRMNDTIDGCEVTGEITMDGNDIYARDMDTVFLRQWVGMVFQKPNPFPKSIYENVAYGPRIHGLFRTKSELDDIVEQSLIGAGLWDEVKDRLRNPGTGLSGGQQQRLCIARAIAVNPEVILMDEPASALDPIATRKIEELIHKLAENYTIVIVTHSMAQAQRVADKTAFFYAAGLTEDDDSNLIEFGDTAQVFNNPIDERTRQYVEGAFG